MRPKSYPEDRPTVQFRLPREMLEKLTKLADERMISRNLIVVKALEDYFIKLESSKEI